MSDDLSDFRKVGAQLSNWGRWGEADEIGTVNFITAECRLAATRTVRRGVVFDLGMPLDANGPQRGGSRFNPIHRMTSIPMDGERPDGMLVSDDVVTMPLQCATQWDGLTHVGYDGFLYNGAPASSVTAAWRRPTGRFCTFCATATFGRPLRCCTTRDRQSRRA